MKKCLILLVIFIAALIISATSESKGVEMPENSMAINNSKAEYTALKD